MYFRKGLLIFGFIAAMLFATYPQGSAEAATYSNITINAGAALTNISKSGTNPVTYTPTADNAVIGVDNINADLDAGNAVIIDTTSAGGSQEGRILVNAPIVKSGGADTDITLIAEAGLNGNNAGIWVNQPITNIGGGDITLTNNASGPGTHSGIFVTGQTISTGTGDITLNGKAGATGGNGVYLFSHANVSTGGNGSITYTGEAFAGTGANGNGVFVNNPHGTQATTTVDGNITVTGTGTNMGVNPEVRGTFVATGSGNIVISGTGASHGFRTNLSSAVQTQTGNLTINGTSTGSGYGVHHRNSSSVISTSSGTLKVEGTSAGSHGIFVEVNAGFETTSGGNIDIDATGVHGFRINGGKLASSGTLAVDGTASGGIGIQLLNAVDVDATGQIDISGTSQTAFGVSMTAGNTIDSTSTGPINITGDGVGGIEMNNLTVQSAGSINVMADGTTSAGLLMRNTVTLAAAGSGALNVTAISTGGNGIDQSTPNGQLTQLTTVDGDITINATGGNNGNGMLFQQAGLIESTGSGNLDIQGTGSGTGSAILFNFSSKFASNSGNITMLGTTTGTGEDFRNANGTDQQVTSTSGDITITADKIVTLNALTFSSSGHLLIQPRTAGTTIGLGGTAGSIQFNDNPLARIADGFASVTFGNSTAGDINLVTAAFNDDLTLVTGGNIIDLSGSNTDIVNTGNTVTLNGTVSPGGTNIGNFTIVGDAILADGSTFLANLTGTPTGGSHDKLNVTGNITLENSNVTLSLETSAYTENAGSITIIDETGTLAGTFVGLAEGAETNTGATPNFEVSYAASVVLTAAQSPTAVVLDYFNVTANADGTVSADWETASEIDHAGFNLYRRAVNSRDSWSQINSNLIASLGVQGQGAVYQFDDTSVTTGEWEYLLEDVETDGDTYRHTDRSATVTVGVPTAITLSGQSSTSPTTFAVLVQMVALLLATLGISRKRQS